MCIVCIEMAKGKLNYTEAKRALSEIAMDPDLKDHTREVLESIHEKEAAEKAKLPSNPVNPANSPPKGSSTI